MDSPIYFSRFEKPLPKIRATIEILIYTDKPENGETFVCVWVPKETVKYKFCQKPSRNYLGRADVIEGQLYGVSFHAWKNKNIEFEFYRLM